MLFLSVKKSKHEFVPLIQLQRSSGGYRLIIRRLSGSRNSGPRHGKRHRAMTMCPRRQRRSGIGRYQDAPVAMSRERFQERTNNVPVDLFERLDLFFDFAFMGSFVGRFDVDTNQIMMR